MYDPYLYEDVPVLKNKLGIKEEKTLNLIEAEQSSANMMLLYQRGFQNFTPEGLCEIHRFLFGDLYDWAGQYRIINIEKREALLAGRSVWYSNDEAISEDLHAAFQHFMQASWIGISREQFVHQLARLFPPDLAGSSLPGRKYPRRGNDADFLCGALWLLYGSGFDGGQCRLRSQFFCAGFSRSVFRI